MKPQTFSINFPAGTTVAARPKTDAEQDRETLARLRAIEAAIIRGERYPAGYHGLRREAAAAERRLARGVPLA